ncbi:peptidoglycan recognition protein family protein [Tenggerimyces flavus]|uniref:N-acetylmuramoyl-L-alanine amidase n=1 Tax=Tenggerimyces flavus TaxID=1708749 RepID=A0ABV7Y617_9ACTN|nr:peptidoglycan-binding protein [Tenggerimyces flavus]MBM7788396.1 N-acetyl-anhydromuramyl-L-alanine amidase AmpD [Tenggerimyces flavus]
MGDQVEPGRRTVLKAGVGVAAAAFVGTGIVSAPAAQAAPSQKFPWIIDCDGWGARPPAGELPLSAIPTNKIILHHMAFPNVTDYSRAQGIKLAKDCQNLHMDGNGWTDTGQHFTISRGGYVMEGRRGSLAQLDTGGNQVISAHCPGENGRSIGIEHEGTYITDIPTEALIDSSVQLCVAICEQYGLHGYDLFGHWDFRHTQCPGIAFYSMFPAIKRRVARGLGEAMKDAPERRWPDVWRFVNSESVRTAQYLLNSRGYTLTTDGAFGPMTVAAVQDWQSRQGIPVDIDATLTPSTWETLVQVLRPGATSPAISAVQSMLAMKGFGTTVNGAYDNVTFNAVQRLQRLHGLRPNGELTESTWCALVGGTVRESFR